MGGEDNDDKSAETNKFWAYLKPFLMLLRNMKKYLLILFPFLAVTCVTAQSPDSESEALNPLKSWHLSDLSGGTYPGIGYKKATALAAGKTATPVVVAVIDSGTETFHEDLKDALWINTDETPDNQIDDDKNGYIDDIHGWSFIGGKGGDVSVDNLEFIRIYREYKQRFGDVIDANKIPKKEKPEFEKFLRLQKEFERRTSEASENLAQYSMVASFYETGKQTISKILGKENYTLEEVQSIVPNDEEEAAIIHFIGMVMEQNLEGEILEGIRQFEALANFQLNPDFDPRHLVGDNYTDVNERYYGNNHIDGPEGEHGTHVAGIIAATHNQLGIDGICPHAQIMVIRCVPNGDERDKDVANAIRYATDNGARIINMSFGKSWSPQKSAVDEAVKYAESKNVLLVHAAGNDGKNIDELPNFPKDQYDDGGYCTTWLEVGASNYETDHIAADFSNFGKKGVDLFAPGVDIYSCIPNNAYKENSGTSMAAPVASGCAAMLLAYYPKLSAKEVKEILMKTVTKFEKKKIEKFKMRNGMGRFFARIFISKKKSEETEMPRRLYKKTHVSFASYCVTGGVINLGAAMKLAESYHK
jgi:subtilisin family serine protease